MLPLNKEDFRKEGNYLNKKLDLFHAHDVL